MSKVHYEQKTSYTNNYTVSMTLCNYIDKATVLKFINKIQLVTIYLLNVNQLFLLNCKSFNF